MRIPPDRLRGVKVALQITRLNLRAVMEYRVNFLLAILAGIIWQASVLVLATVLVNRFPGLGGWSKGDVILIAALRLMSHGLYVAIFVSVPGLPWLVQDGRMESYMLRPLPVYRQVMLSHLHLNALGDLAVAATLFSIALSSVPVAWTVPHMAYLVLSVIGGMLLEAGLHTFIASFAMRSVPTSPWSQWLDEIFATFGSYPLSIVPAGLRITLTYVVPIAFVGYIPAGVIAAHDGFPVPDWLALGAPAVGLAVFLAARRFFYLSLRSYTGVGG